MIRKTLALALAVCSLAGCAAVGEQDETTGSLAGDDLVAGGGDDESAAGEDADGLPGAERGERSHVTSVLRAYGDERNGPQPIPWQPAPAAGSGGNGKD